MQQHNAPNEPGWWAFEGRYKDVGAKLFRDVYELIVRGDSLHVEMKGIGIDWPVTQLEGKWTRIYMPWETPAAQPHRFICAACNDYLDPLEPSYCNICYDTMESAATMQAEWEPVEDGPHEFPDSYGGGLVILASSGKTLDVYDIGSRATVECPDNIRLMRRRPA